MKRVIAVAIALGATVGMSGLALAQPAYGPNAVYYPYAAPAPPAVVVYPPTVYPQVAPYEDTHSSGGASRAYSYWGSQKSN